MLLAASMSSQKKITNPVLKDLDCVGKTLTLAAFRNE